MFLLQKGGVSAHFSGQIFGFCPIREAYPGRGLRRLKRSVSLLTCVGMSDVQGMFFSTLFDFFGVTISRTYFIRRTLS